MSNWSEPTVLRLFSQLPSSVVKKEAVQPHTPAPQKPAPQKPESKKIDPKPMPRPVLKPKPLPKKPAPTENLDAMLQSIDSTLDLCSKTPAPLKIAVKASDHPFYVRLKSAIAAHIGEVVEEGADLVLGKGGDIELLEPEAYTPEKKRALWDELKKRARRQ